MGLRQGFDVPGRDGIKQEDFCLLTGHSQHRPEKSARTHTHTHIRDVHKMQDKERVSFEQNAQENGFIR